MGEGKLKRLKSDLRDCRDPKVLKKWPNLGNPELIQELELKIAAIEEEMNREKSDG